VNIDDDILIVQLQAEIERLKTSLGKHADRILELHERLKVIQDAADHCLIDVCPTKTPAVYEALWGGDK